MLDRMSSNLAANLRRLREARSLTQAELSRLSEVPRPTLAHLESGGANPTLGVLVKVADALQASIEQLVGAPQPAGVVYSAESLPRRTRGKVTIRSLLPDKQPAVGFERLEFAVGGRLTLPAGSAGTRQYLACDAGDVEVSSDGEQWRLHRGDLLMLRGDRARVVLNVGRGKAISYSLVTWVPLGE
jgi:transcriptional regulator with XRE-family HTH domain